MKKGKKRVEEVRIWLRTGAGGNLQLLEGAQERETDFD